jgi:membrane protein DedA with SNARE-associated domain
MPDFIHLIRDWGYSGIFLVVILGNIGLPVPEETVLALAGYLVWAGQFRVLPVLLVGIVSAVAGDTFGYWLGRKYGRTVIDRFAGNRGRVAAAERFIRRYGVLAVAAARFVGGLRFLAGPLAGSLGMPFRSFLIGNILGAVLFVPYAVGIGYAVGYGLGPHVARVQHALGTLGVAVVIGALVLVACRMTLQFVVRDRGRVGA